MTLLEQGVKKKPLADARGRYSGQFNSGKKTEKKRLADSVFGERRRE